MPILKDTAPVKYPASNLSLVKYLDLTKFISLLQRQSLFFCRLDKLEDKFEGTTANKNYDYRIASQRNIRLMMSRMPSYTQSEKTDPYNEESILQSVKEQYEFESQLKSINCINCWNYYDQESAALWKIYSDFGKGIMIKTDLNKIELSLINSIEDIRVSEVTYIDYQKDLMPDYNSFYPLIHKDLAYSYEKEVRLIHEVPLGDIGWEHDWTKAEVEEGVYINVDISILIDELFVAPHAPNWYYDLIKNLCSKYQLDKPITKSRLSSQK